ncbi:MAG: hypothetical protein ACO329_00690 [Steroidobacteraceae bacterium]|jgi:hypothetical protein
MKHKAVNVARSSQYASLALPVAVVLSICAPAAAADTSPLRPSRAPDAPQLDLRVGDIRTFLPRAEWAEPLPADIDEVIVRSRKKEPDIPERKAVPQGLGGLFWAATRPTEAWRLLVPDPNQPKIPDRSSDDPKEPPGAYRSRIGEPGKIF